MKQLSSLLIPFFFAFLLLASGASMGAEDQQFDVYVWSKDYQPGRSVFVNVTGPVNMSISIRITDWNGIIVSGRDAALDARGNYSFGWIPSQDGNYNATVQFSTGLSITRQFTIQDKVTSEDIGEIYQSIFRLQDRILKALDTLSSLVYVAIALSVTALLVSAFMFNYMRQRFSRTETEFEKFLRQDVKSQIQKRGK